MPAEAVGFVVTVGLHGLLQVTSVVLVIPSMVVCDEVRPCGVVGETLVDVRALAETGVVDAGDELDGKPVSATSPRVAATMTATMTPTAIFLL